MKRAWGEDGTSNRIGTVFATERIWIDSHDLWFELWPVVFDVITENLPQQTMVVISIAKGHPSDLSVRHRMIISNLLYFVQIYADFERAVCPTLGTEWASCSG
jgi:hypothetical protein